MNKTDSKVYFSINNNNKIQFSKSNDMFFNDYYEENEIVDIILFKENKNTYNLISKYSNGIVLKKTLHTMGSVPN